MWLVTIISTLGCKGKRITKISRPAWAKSRNSDPKAAGKEREGRLAQTESE